MKKNLEYNIGIDIGTNSVGWSVTNDANELIRFRRKNMWGARLFEEGSTAKDTRVARSARRRYVRRRGRIILLQNLMEPLIQKVDETFFLRMDESFLHITDRTYKDKNGLFCDENFNDVDFFNKYKTIYHLRKALIDSDEKMDIRLIYLALHHIIKYRGNFLYQGQKMSSAGENIENVVRKLFDVIEQNFEEFSTAPELLTKMVAALNDGKKDNRIKKENIENICMEITKDKKIAKEMTKACFGNKFSLNNLLATDIYFDEAGEKISIEFSSANYEEKEAEYEEILDDRYLFINALKGIYDNIVLMDILCGKSGISEAMCAKYEKHGQDLIILKRLLKTHFSEEYTKFFWDEEEKGKVTKNYMNYKKGDKNCNKEELYKTIEKIIKKKETELKDEADYLYCIREMANDNFLKKLNDKTNATVPYQLNESELSTIIEKQGKYYSELLEIKDKIESIMTFRIPYYVGPLNSNSRFAWIKKNTDEKIYPWNFDEVVDRDASAEEFIKRMTNFCTYFPAEKVMAKNSLLYSKYEVLSEIKQIRVNGKFISIEDRKAIYNDLFKRYKTVKEDHLIKWLKTHQYPGETYEIRGYQKDKEFASSLKSYIEFTKIFGKIDNSNSEMIEEIIYWLTVFEDKAIVERKIKKKYNLEKKVAKQVLKLNYTGWSRLSEKMLVQINTVYKDGTKKNIMELLEETDENLMQIINSKEYTFKDEIKKEQDKYGLNGKGIKISDIKELYGSPAIKKSVWQTVQIVNEVIKIMGNDPKNIFIEFAREDAESQRTNSRYKQLNKILEAINKDTEYYNREVNSKIKEYEKRMNEDKLYLYFLQNGKCMYTGESLSLDRLEEYEIDHIVPQSFIKDDSVENRVLVLHSANQEKKDIYPINSVVQGRMRNIWNMLFKNGLMGAKKYYSLTRVNLDDRTQRNFINRQLVETRQICKHVAKLFTESYVNTNIITVKANLTSDFKNKYNIYKNRNINDFHHANDAYLAATLGNYILKRFPNLEDEIIYKEFLKYKKKQDEEKKTSKEKNGYILATMNEDFVCEETGEIIWEHDNSIANIKKILNYRDCIITKKTEIGTGKLFNATLLSKKEILKVGKGIEVIPIKKKLSVEKYGGYGRMERAYSCVIQYLKNGKTEKALVGIPVYIVKQSGENKEKIKEYLESKRGYENVSILKDRVPKHQLIEEKGIRKYIISDMEIYNAKQFTWDSGGDYNELIYKINKGRVKEEEKEKLSNELNEFYMYFIKKLSKEYSEIYESVIPKLKEKYEEFTEYSYEDKVNFANEVLKITACKAINANLKKFELSIALGKKNGYNMKVEDTVFINQSVTGLFETRQSL